MKNSKVKIGIEKKHFGEGFFSQDNIVGIEYLTVSDSRGQSDKKKNLDLTSG